MSTIRAMKVAVPPASDRLAAEGCGQSMRTPRHALQGWPALLSLIFALTVAANISGCAGRVSGIGSNENVSDDLDNINDNIDPVDEVPQWAADFDATGLGFVSVAWGSSPDDVFVGGGQEESGEILHDDGTFWSVLETPTDEDCVSLWGTSEDKIVAVRGRAVAQGEAPPRRKRIS